MDALAISWPCSRCSHPADRHGYDDVCATCERQKKPRDGSCTLSVLYPEAALVAFPSHHGKVAAVTS
jgi:hypothetical protein